MDVVVNLGSISDALKDVGESVSPWAHNWGCFAFDEECWDAWETIPLGFGLLEDAGSDAVGNWPAREMEAWRE